jgi:hypothetical protein
MPGRRLERKVGKYVQMELQQLKEKQNLEMSKLGTE